LLSLTISDSFLAVAVSWLILTKHRLAAELVARGNRVSFAVFDEGKAFAQVAGVHFFALGSAKDALKAEQDTIASDSVQRIAGMSSLRVLPTVINDIYLPYSDAMFEPIMAALQEYVSPAY
jgi:hypothetical protein